MKYNGYGFNLGGDFGVTKYLCRRNFAHGFINQRLIAYFILP
jgi:hypothetical protein